MVVIAPFRGLTYKLSDLADHGDLLTAPPYDVLSKEEREAYYKRHQHNILHVDLGPTRPDDPDKYTWHERSFVILKKWLAEGVLERRPNNAIFHVETESENLETGLRSSRHGLICLIKLEEFGPNSSVKPHEKTFSSHKEERLDLMKKSSAQLSQVFVFCPDPGNKCLDLMMDYNSSKKPDIDLTDAQNIRHRVRINEDPVLIKRIQDILSSQKAFIADGHHRYETALNYRRWLAAEGRLTPDHPANYVMVALSPGGDPGLYILPTHRLLNTRMSNVELLAAVEPYFKLEKKIGGDLAAIKDKLRAELAEFKKLGFNTLGLSLKGDPEFYIFTMRENAKQTPVLKNAPPSLAVIDTFILSNLVFQEAFGLTEKEMDDPDLIAYISNFTQALKTVESGAYQAAFLLNPTSIEEVISVAGSDQVMPRKSTFFYPKVKTGLVINYWGGDLASV